ncbi:XRE family transcriptional regulator [bacterium]|jgi:predicted XRE-type DNA-binding protein|nr:XRE family transcriptional regulator [bacterium]
MDVSTDKVLLKNLGYDGEEGTVLLLRIQLLKTIKQEIDQRGWNQDQAAKFLNVKQPRISEIKKLRIDKFSVEQLTKLLHRLDKRISLTVAG